MREEVKAAIEKILSENDEPMNVFRLSEILEETNFLRDYLKINLSDIVGELGLQQYAKNFEFFVSRVMIEEWRQFAIR